MMTDGRPATRRAMEDAHEHLVLFDLAGFMGSGPAHLAWRGFEENVPERLARLVHEKRMKPAQALLLVEPAALSRAFGHPIARHRVDGERRAAVRGPERLARLHQPPRRPPRLATGPRAAGRLPARG